jgi:hypothetical protein
LGGLLIWVTTLYCAPAPRRPRRGHRGRRPRAEPGAGVYPEWALLRIQEGKTPALLREVARQTALLPSYELTRQELAEHGLELDIKEVHRIGQHAGQAALTYRRRQVEQYRLGELPSQDGRGKRFAAMIDGGRTKVRTCVRRQQGQGKTKTRKRRFRTAWREVKQIIVFEMDQQGRMKPGTRPIVDGTFAGPDEILEVLAMRLHQVGAAQAEVVAFRSDGAPWIWERLEWVIRRVGLTETQVSLGLDWCHAVHHVSRALEPLVPAEQRQQVFKKMRTQLKGGGWAKVVDELIRLGLQALLPEDSPVWTEVMYLFVHGEAGHLDYARYRKRGLPLGSGAIESAIRRVINLRLKGNSIYWEEENAEGMLLVRALVLTGRWKDTFGEISKSITADRRMQWKWTGPDMAAELKTPQKIMPPKSQPPTTQGGYGAAA